MTGEPREQVGGGESPRAEEERLFNERFTKIAYQRGSNRMIIFGPDEVEELELVATGPQTLEALESGETELVSMRTNTYTGLLDFLQNNEPEPYVEIPSACLPYIDDDVYKAWKDTLSGQEDIVRIAKSIVEAHDSQETVEGAIRGGGEDHPYSFARCPAVMMFNELTGESTGFVLDIPRLIAEGELVPERRYNERTYPDGSTRAEVAYILPVHAYFKEKGTSIGVDIDEDSVMMGERHIPLDAITHRNGVLLRASWDGEKGTLLDTSDTYTDLGETLESLQEGKARHISMVFDEPESWLDASREEKEVKYGHITDEHAVIRGFKLRIRPRRSMYETFTDLVNACHAQGYKLGYKQRFYDTGTTVPSFFISGTTNENLRVLSLNMKLREAVEFAWHAVTAPEEL
jgi:hypothetical protein